ncbi:zinc finger-containing ubiquitin peptidase 1 isoform X2 [Amia ocellicauda]|uniref:zinc finger-containing ubiquitin peptidase 1 isoform X2 n=1 Tax=Amia ocellicauda TaxID=2972642 RepID=UPI0034646116
MFTCDICGEEGLSEADMKTHLLLRHVENDMCCPFCCLSGVTYDELQFHIDIAHSEDQVNHSNCTWQSSDQTGKTTETKVNSRIPSEVNTDEVMEISSSSDAANVMPVGSPASQKSMSVVCSNSNDTAQLSDQFSLKGDVLKTKTQGKSDKACQKPNEAEISASERTAKSPRQQDATEEKVEEQVKSKQKRFNSPKKGTLYPCPMCTLVCADCYILQEHVELHLQEQIMDKGINKPPPKTPSGAKSDIDDERASSSLDMNNKDLLGCAGIEGRAETSGDGNAEESSSATASASVKPKIPSNSQSDWQLARKLQEEEEIQWRKEEAKREAEEFKRLQKQFGLDNSGGYKQQHIQTMQRAVSRGQMMPSEYHRRKAEMMESLALGLDDGKTKTSGIIGALREYYQREERDTAHVWLCAETDHYHSSGGDKGWGCGYRNFQMLLSSLLRMDYYKDCFKCDGVPCIVKVQDMIEDAWRGGFDPQGASHFNNRLQGTRAWIGATEIYSVLTSLRVRTRIVDFHRPTGPSDTHPRLFEWIKNYFSLATSRGVKLPPRVVQTSKPPIYLQHQGHSRTIVGIEEKKNRNLCLLIFDPGCPPHDMQKLLGQNLNGGSLRHLRRFTSGLKHKQYQVVAVEGVLSQEEKQACLQNSRILHAEKIP